MRKKMNKLINIVSFSLFALVLQACATPIEQKGAIFVKGNELGKADSNYWLLNGTAEATPVNYTTVIDYWESLYTNLQLLGKRDSTIYTLVDTCVDKYCQKVTIEIINGTTKNYQIETQNFFKNMTDSSLDGAYGKRDDVEYESQCTRKICGMNVKSLAKYYNLAAATFDFTSNVYTVASDIVDRIVAAFKKDKEECSGFTLENIIIDPYVSWNAFVSTYTTGKNCDTTAKDENIKCAVRTALEAEHNHQKTAFCLHIDHGGTFNMDIRIIAKTSVAMVDPWRLPCATIGDDWTKTSDCW
ncbi:hypothetical protein KAFR_0K00140 [Kazachstania africana CBS 2517]|uniref:Secreted protein CSS2 C-terminal domain-containing protein n=1 Tax=Kazachstania africana (strain ATCC 22294 / BCRC 22015 / CBS 2517 / CECT 1963 / NBRC 1671 / NRRL Y-8276) TaxID=1071382 RepID=H2B168_KAZAF|nr:hypothetical protein KAFR_0K00140 [Kazachstania africana CBS 2517]CCF60368.1 hypothetical protein KAFR_0K00140 [Kazachstania africana CBS 2517]